MGEKKYKQVKKSSGSKTSKPVRTSKKVKNRKLSQKYSKKSLKTDSDNSDSEPEIVSYKRTNKKKSQKYESDKSESESEIESEIESGSELDKYDNDNDFRNVIFENINDEYALGKFGDLEVVMMRENGYVNATNLCKKCGKDYKNWKRNDNSKELVGMLIKDINLPKHKLIISIKGGFNTKIRGTYVHPIILTNIATWISPSFSIKISIWIEEWKNFCRNNERKYYYLNMKPYSNNNKEKIIQLEIQKKLGGDIEVPTKYGYIDLVTNDKIIEIKTYDNWKYALGQILSYGDLYEDKKKYIYLFDIPLNTNTGDIKTLFKKYNVSLVSYSFKK
ncbi:putative KilA-N domain-containing protein [Powai lake megavirus]|uniref:Putative KilA-N domain-containing protein n=1 Tax=Powai lake megavirus TaxID=1842663 RepID=A0A161HUZ1_9VIRU|nr:putative KilA-N domain-containing protein [Powai lake megavirus]ANB50970.1 putative KilA-N domain-containing protein [Powai lake megavirus]